MFPTRNLEKEQVNRLRLCARTRTGERRGAHAMEALTIKSMKQKEKRGITNTVAFERAWLMVVIRNEVPRLKPLEPLEDALTSPHYQ
jgi:hypothetical protein